MAQTVQSILKKVKALEIKSKKLVNNAFSGEYQSAFKGMGMSFKEVREYAPGDDVRFIDWNTSARFGHPYSKVFEEERELTVMLLIDFSSSNNGGSHTLQKREYIIELAALMAFSAVANGDKVGAIFFTGQVEQYIPPKKGKDQMLYLIRRMLSFEPRHTGTDISAAVRYANRFSRHRAILFLLSDFDAEGFDKALKTVAQRHDCIGIHVHDRIEYRFADVGLMAAEDAETGEVMWIDTSKKAFREYWEAAHFKRVEVVERKVKNAGWDYILFDTGQDYVNELQQFFRRRIKKTR